MKGNNTFVTGFLVALGGLAAIAAVRYAQSLRAPSSGAGAGMADDLLPAELDLVAADGSAAASSLFGIVDGARLHPERFVFGIPRNPGDRSVSADVSLPRPRYYFGLPDPRELLPSDPYRDLLGDYPARFDRFAFGVPRLPGGVGVTGGSVPAGDAGGSAGGYPSGSAGVTGWSASRPRYNVGI